MSPSCGKTNGFEEGDLSDSGKWLYHMLRGEENQKDSGENSTAANNRPDDTTEGVFTDGDMRIRASVKNSWEAEGTTVYQYELVLENISCGDKTRWEIAIPFHSGITLSDGWNGEYDAQGRTLRIRSKDYNGSVPAGGTVSDIGFIVSGGDGIAF